MVYLSSRLKHFLFTATGNPPVHFWLFLNQKFHFQTEVVSLRERNRFANFTSSSNPLTITFVELHHYAHIPTSECFSQWMGTTINRWDPFLTL